MKQAEKNRKSRAFILKHAFAEFAERGYSGSSLNQICARGNISKGLLYHYYASKDALYIACVELLFQDMTNFLKTGIQEDTITVNEYFAVRARFFQQYPAHRQLFYDVLMYPQSHLQPEIEPCRAEFDQLNNTILLKILRKEQLAADITLEEALVQFRAFVNFLGVYIREDTNADAEQKTSALLHTMLYGLIAR